jgi:hypothetical protein
MKGDFSRFTFDEVNQYSRVLMQQGRVLLDADWNESAEIQIHYLRALAEDLMGPHAAPTTPDGDEGGGFLIDKKVDDNGNEQKDDFSIGAGRYYVRGIRCENPGPASYRVQPDLPDDKVHFDAGKPHLVYLEVWERHITPTETDNPIDEPALGTADTCTRSEIVWQVKSRALDTALTAAQAAALKADYDEFLKLLAMPEPGRLSARVEKPSEPDTPCLSAPEARFRGTENQLYRVEIHTGGDRSTFKWSRENGSEIYSISSQSGAIFTVTSTGRDDRSVLQPDDWVELVDDDYTRLNLAGPLLRVVTVDPDSNQMTVDPAPTRVPGAHAYLRRWNSNATGIAAASAAALGGWIPLEDGVQIKFDTPAAKFTTGQYWTIPARTATGDVIWAQSPTGPVFRLPSGRHAFAPLAIVAFKADLTVDKITDLRRKLQKIWK